MPSFAYRGIDRTGGSSNGVIEAPTRAIAVLRVRQSGVVPVELNETAAMRPIVVLSGRSQAIVTKTIGELAVLLGAGLSLDRALGLTLENIEHPATLAGFVKVLQAVREGVPLARAMAAQPALFSPMAQAMVEAGEANGELGTALAQLAENLERAQELRTLYINAMIYPAVLAVIATGVVLLMLLFVVPQFESIFAANVGQLPATTQVVIGASRLLRENGLLVFVAIAALVFGLRQLSRSDALRAVFDRWVLRLPMVGRLVQYSQTAQFSRTLSALINGGVALPTALGMAQKTLSNSQMATAVARVAVGLKQGGGLSAPLAATGLFPKLALGFFRTGEETSQLGLMLGRLADVLDREVRVRLARLIGVITPVITVLLGAAVATIIAAVMTAIMGFNDLALG